MMSQEYKLLPCPFCGSEAEILYKKAPSNIIACSDDQNCPAYCITQNHRTWEECVNAWNTRTPDAAPVSEELKPCRRVAHDRRKVTKVIVGNTRPGLLRLDDGSVITDRRSINSRRAPSTPDAGPLCPPDSPQAALRPVEASKLDATQDCREAFYSYYIDRHGVEPDDNGADREARLDFSAGYQAASAETQRLREENEQLRATKITAEALLERETLQEMQRLKRQVEVLRGPWSLTSPRYKSLMQRYMPGVFYAIEALATADKIAKE